MVGRTVFTAIQLSIGGTWFKGDEHPNGASGRPVRPTSSGSFSGRSYGTVSLLRLGRYWSGFPLRRWHGGAPEVTRWAYGHFGNERVTAIAIVSIRHNVAAMGCRAGIQSSTFRSAQLWTPRPSAINSRVPATLTLIPDRP